MNTLNTDNHNDNDSATLHVYDKSTPSTELELLVEALLHVSHFRAPTKEAFDILGHLSVMGNIDASLLLARLTSKGQLSDAVLSSVKDNLTCAIEGGDTAALLVYFNTIIESDKPTKAKEGLKGLCEMGEDGCPDAFWLLAQHYSKNGDPLSVVYGEKAEESGFPPAKDAMSYARAFSTIAMQKATKQNEAVVKCLNKQIQKLTVNLEEQKAGTHSEQDALAQQISYWKQLAENAEAGIASLTAESLRDEAIDQLKNTISGLEDQVLEAQCSHEKANAERVKAERLADDLTRQNKYLTSLLRKSGKPFNEYESSSSSDGGQP